MSEPLNLTALAREFLNGIPIVVMLESYPVLEARLTEKMESIAALSHAAGRAEGRASPTVTPDPAEPTPWCEDALFLITTHGDGAGARIARGWSALCDAIVDIHYFEPDGLQREEVLARVAALDDWQNADDGPYFLSLDYEDGSVSITRVTDAGAPQVTPDPAEKELDVEELRRLVEVADAWISMPEVCAAMDEFYAAWNPWTAKAVLSDHARLVAERDYANALAADAGRMEVIAAERRRTAEAEAARLKGEVARLREVSSELISAAESMQSASNMVTVEQWKRLNRAVISGLASLALTESSPGTKKIEHVNLQARLDQDTDLKLRLKEHARRFPDPSPSTEGEPT